MLANVLTHNLNHTEIIDCGLADNTEVTVIFELSSTLSHQHVLPQDGANFGIGVYSKWPFQWLEVFEPIESVPSLEIVFEHVLLIATHPLPPMGPAGFRVQNLQPKDLVRRVCNVKRGRGGPILVVGDLILTPWSPIFSDFEAACCFQSGMV